MLYKWKQMYKITSCRISNGNEDDKVVPYTDYNYSFCPVLNLFLINLCRERWEGTKGDEVDSCGGVISLVSLWGPKTVNIFGISFNQNDFCMCSKRHISWRLLINKKEFISKIEVLRTVKVFVLKCTYSLYQYRQHLYSEQ